jgi:hypothetical protein
MAGYLKNAQTQLAYLPYFKPDNLDWENNRYYDFLSKPTSEVLKRIRCMSRYMHDDGLTHAEALARTDKSFYYFLLLSRMHRTQLGNFKKIPFFRMYLIGSFLAPSSLSLADLSDWSLQALKGVLTQCLAQYQQSDWSFSTRHRERAASFKKAVAGVTSRDELPRLLKLQSLLLFGDNPYSQDQQNEKYQTSTTTRTSDSFPNIVSRWHKRLNGVSKDQKSEVAQEPKNETAQEGQSETVQESKSEASATRAVCPKR